MYRRVAVFACLMAFVGLSFTANGFAGKYNKKLSVGDKAPGFEAITGIDDKSHSIGDYAKAKVLVLCFTCNTCPVAAGYNDRFVKFTNEYKDKGVEFVAINVNNDDDNKLDKMRERAQKSGFNFDYLHDSSQESARAFGATLTQQIFVLCKDRKVVYMGKFDDSLNPRKIKNNYVRDAVDATLVGKKVEVTETRQIGCSIGYEPGSN